MEDLFTILVILAFIISFLNKIFGTKKKQQQPTRRRPAADQKRPEWLPPWLEPEETEHPIPDESKEDLDIVETIEQQTVVTEQQQETTPVPAMITEPEPLSRPGKEDTLPPQPMPLKALGIELSSRDELRRGIILAEILGPCRARRRKKKI